MTQLVSEFFEGVGAPAGWTESGLADFDDSSNPIDNVKSLVLDGTSSAITPVFAASDSVEVYFTIRFDGSLPASSNTEIVSIQAAGGVDMARVFISNSVARFKLYHGGVTVNGPTNLVAGTVYHCWFEATKSGVGLGDGVADFYYSETPTKPGASAMGMTNGSGEVAAEKVEFSTTQSRGFTPITIDRVVVDDAAVTVPAVTAPGGGPDVTPDAFELGAAVTDVALLSVHNAAQVTLAGVVAATDIPVTVTNGEVSIDGGAYGSAATVAQLGQTIDFRVTASAAGNTEVVGTLTVGGVSDTFSVTTAVVPVNVGFRTEALYVDYANTTLIPDRADWKVLVGDGTNPHFEITGQSSVSGVITLDDDSLGSVGNIRELFIYNDFTGMSYRLAAAQLIDLSS